MTRVKKFISLVIALVLMSTVLCGCTYIVDSTASLNSKVVLKVGNEEVTYGQFASMYETAYRNYYTSMYQQYGSVPDTWLSYLYGQAFTTACKSLVTSYTLLNAYKTDSASATYEHDYVAKFKDSKFLTADEMGYVIRYTKASFYTSLNTLVENYFTDKGLTFAAVETDSIVREAEEYYDITTSLARENYKLDLTGINKNLELAATDTLNYKEFIEKYSFTAQDITDNNANLVALVDALNERLIRSNSAQKELTLRDYVVAQKQAVETLYGNVYSNYGIRDINKYIENQIQETITNIIIQKAQYTNLEKVLEGDKDKLVQVLSNYWNSIAKNASEQYTLDDDAFFTFMKGLSDDSFITEMPDDYQFIFVKNIVIPFTTTQKAELSTLKTAISSLTKQEGETDAEFSNRKAKATEDFNQYRQRFAEEILAENFTDDGQPLTAFFTYNETTQKLELVADTALKTALDGLDAKPDNEKGAAFEEIMYKYNTDPGAANHYDYVYCATEDSGYTTGYATEFNDACKEVYELGKGKYVVAVTEYGIHIIFYDSDIAQELPTFTKENIYDTSTLEHRFFKYFYNNAANSVTAAYYKELLAETKIKSTTYFNKLIKNWGYELPDFAE